jgi:hypothetical protein
MWTPLLENPEAITSLYAEEPSLTSIRLMSIELLEDGPTVRLNLDLHDYPLRPPARWSRINANAVTMVLELLAVSEISINGWSSDNVISCELRRLGEAGLKVILIGTNVRGEVNCLAARVAHVTGYKRRI